jgi:hypothetical protein
MKPIDITSLSDKAVKLLLNDCEEKMRNCEADLDDYELFVRCQRELLKRQTRKEVSEQHFAFF